MEKSDIDTVFFKKPLCRQIWVSSAVFLHMIGQGMMFGYPSCILPALRDPDFDFKVDVNVVSWIASSIGFATLPGYLFSPIFMEYYGRRIANILAVLPAAIGWLLIYFSQNITTIIIGRIFGGFAAGSTIILGAISIGEYTSPEYRGVLLNLKSTCICIGSMIVHLLGTHFHWRTLALVAFTPHFIAVIIVFTWPESPSFLAAKKRFDQSEKTMFWLRGKNPKSVKELEDLFALQIERHKFEDKQNTSLIKNFQNGFKSLNKKELYKPLLVFIATITVMEFSGRHIFPAFISDIVGGMLGDKTNVHIYTLALDIIITVSAFLSSILVKFLTRRALLLITGFVAVITLIPISILCYLMSIKVLSSSYSWIAMILLVLYLVLVNLGPIPIPIAYLGELLPLSLKGIGTAFSGIIFSSILQVSLQITPYLLANIEVYGTFAVICVILSVSFFVLYFIMPETKDKNLLEIENYFKCGDYNGKDRIDDIEIKETTEILIKDKPVNNIEA